MKTHLCNLPTSSWMAKRPAALAVLQALILSFSCCSMPVHAQAELPLTFASTWEPSVSVDPTDASTCQRVEIAKDDFEQGLDSKWNCGLVAHHPSFTSFATSIVDRLGTQAPVTFIDSFDQEGCDLSRFFEVSPIAENVNLDFMSYAWCSCADVQVVTCNTTIHIDRNMHRGVPGGTLNGIVWRRENVTSETDARSSQHADRVQKISLFFPPRCYAHTGGLDVKFVFRNIDVVDNRVGGIDNLSLTASICAPTSMPTLPTPFPSIAPTLRPPTPDACIKADDGSRKECHSVVTTTDDAVVGEMCLEVARNSTAVHVSFQAYQDWKFQAQYLWIGEDLSHSPMSLFGDPDVEEFPILWKNPIGEAEIQEFLALRCLTRDSYYRQGIAQLDLVKVDDSGSVIQGTETTAFVTEHLQKTIGQGWYSWFHFVVDCDCFETANSTSTTSGWPSFSKAEPIMPSTAPSPTMLHPSTAPTTVSPTNDTPTSPTKGNATALPTGSSTSTPSDALSTLYPYASPTDHVQTPHVLTTSPSGTPTSGKGACLLTDGEVRGKCFNIVSASSVRVGEACANIVSKPYAVAIDFLADPGWVFLEHLMWTGQNLDNIRRTSSGGADLDMFPYRSENHTGSSDWRALVSIKCRFADVRAYMEHGVAEITLSRQYPNGTLFGKHERATVEGKLAHLSGSDRWLNYFSWSVRCDCISSESSQPSAAPITASTQTPSILQSCDRGPRIDQRLCHNMISEETNLVVGQVCVEPDVDLDRLNVTISAGPYWSFLQHQVWVGPSLQDAPRMGGLLDYKSFPYFWCDSNTTEGSSAWSISLDVPCQSKYDFELYVVARSKAVQILDGKWISESDVFVRSQATDDASSWFYVPVHCDCTGMQHPQSPSVTLPPMTAPTGPTGVCSVGLYLDGSKVDSTKRCKILTNGRGIYVGDVCLDLAGSYDDIEVSFIAAPYWTFLSHHMWIGSFVGDVPKSATGHLDYEAFPYFFCDSSGKTTWATKLRSLCVSSDSKKHTLSLVSRSEAQQVYTIGGEAIRETMEAAYIDDHRAPGALLLGWLDFDIECQCQGYHTGPPVASPIGTMQPSLPPSLGGNVPSFMHDKACIEGDEQHGGDECHPMLLDTNRQVVGSVCASIKELAGSQVQVVELEFTAKEGWMFVQHHMWLDSDFKRVPQTESGRPDESNFPFFWNNTTGSRSWKTVSTLKCNNHRRSKYELIVLAHSLVISDDENKTSEHQAPIAAFGIEHESSRGLVFGWMDFVVNCDCQEASLTTPTDSPSLLPLEHSESPTLPPTTGDMCFAKGVSNLTTCFELEGAVCGRRKVNLAGECAKEPTGTIDLWLDEETVTSGVSLEVLFQASPGRYFQSASLWLGRDMSQLPRRAGDRMPDIHSFPFFLSDNTGYNHTNFRDELQVACNAGEELTFLGVAHAVMQDDTPEDKQDVVSPLASYGYTHDGYGSTCWFGYFDFTIRCNCSSPSPIQSEPLPWPQRNGSFPMAP